MIRKRREDHRGGIVTAGQPPEAVSQLEAMEASCKKTALQNASNALASLKLFMKQSERSYREKAEAILERRSPVEEELADLRAKVQRRDTRIAELRKAMATEILQMATGGMDDLKAFMSLVARGDDMKLIDLQDDICRLTSALKERDAEVQGLKGRLLTDRQRLQTAYDQMAESEVLFRDAIKAAEARSVELKSEISARDVNLLRQSSELFVLESDIKKLRNDDEMHKGVEDNLLAEIKSLRLKVAELEDEQSDYEELHASIVAMEEERTAAIEETRTVHAANTELQEKYERLVEELDDLVAHKKLYRPAAAKTKEADDAEGVDGGPSSDDNAKAEKLPSPKCKLHFYYSNHLSLRFTS